MIVDQCQQGDQTPTQPTITLKNITPFRRLRSCTKPMPRSYRLLRRKGTTMRRGKWPSPRKNTSRKTVRNTNQRHKAHTRAINKTLVTQTSPSATPTSSRTNKNSRDTQSQAIPEFAEHSEEILFRFELFLWQWNMIFLNIKILGFVKNCNSNFNFKFNKRWNLI